MSSLLKQEKGFAMVEAALAILLLGIITVSFYSALANTYTSSFIAEKRAISLRMAQQQLENVVKWGQTYNKSKNYSTLTTFDPVNDDNGNPIDYSKYTLDCSYYWIVPDTGEITTSDTDLQKAVIAAGLSGQNYIITLEGYKVNPN